MSAVDSTDSRRVLTETTRMMMKKRLAGFLYKSFVSRASNKYTGDSNRSSVRRLYVRKDEGQRTRSTENVNKTISNFRPLALSASRSLYFLCLRNSFYSDPQKLHSTITGYHPERLSVSIPGLRKTL